MNPTLISVSVLLSALVAWLVLPRLIGLSHRYGLLDMPGLHKRHKRPVPVLGGVGLFAAIWLTLLTVRLVFPESFSDLAESLIYIFLGAFLVFLVGFSDDLKPLSAWIKLLAEVSAGLILYMGGLRIDPISIPFHGSIMIGQWSIAITVLWVVGLTNAVNIIDGLDGLAAGVSLIGAITLIIVGVVYNVGSVLVFLYSMVGFLAIFLVYNRYPARIFLGDSGALQIGFYFAVISLLVPVKTFTAAALYVPLLALAVPLLEISVSFWRRLAAGRNVMQADRRHLFHYLSLAGLSPKQVVHVFYGLSMTFGLFALAMIYMNRRIVFAALVLFMVVIFLLFFILVGNLTRSKRTDRFRSRN